MAAGQRPSSWERGTRTEGGTQQATLDLWYGHNANVSSFLRGKLVSPDLSLLTVWLGPRILSSGRWVIRLYDLNFSLCQFTTQLFRWIISSHEQLLLYAVNLSLDDTHHFLKFLQIQIPTRVHSLKSSNTKLALITVHRFMSQWRAAPRRLTLSLSDVDSVAAGRVRQRGQVAMVLQSPAVQCARTKRQQVHRVDVQAQRAGLNAGVWGHLADDGKQDHIRAKGIQRGTYIQYSTACDFNVHSNTWELIGKMRIWPAPALGSRGAVSRPPATSWPGAWSWAAGGALWEGKGTVTKASATRSPGSRREKGARGDETVKYNRCYTYANIFLGRSALMRSTEIDTIR